MPRFFPTLIGALLFVVFAPLHASEDPPGDRAWRVVLDVAQERGDAPAEVTGDPAVRSRPHTDAPYLALFRPLRVRVGNPVLERLVQQVNAELRRPDPVWPVATAERPVFSGIEGTFGARVAANRMRQYLWLYAHPDSPLRGEPELLRRVLRRAHAYIDAYALFDLPGAKRTEVYDFFAIKDACSGLVEFITAYPDLLLPAQKEQWERVLRQVTDHLWNGDPLDRRRGALKDARVWNINQEVARMVGLASLAAYLGDESMLAKVRAHTDQVLAKQFPDGALPYNGLGNPSNNYHDEVMLSLTRIYDLTGYEPILDGLRRAQWKGPVMGRTEEFWTSPYFKTFRWNSSLTTESGAESVAAVSGNGYVRGLLDRDRPAMRQISRDDVAWYRGDITPVPLPDRYTILDRNVGGPRAWYGNFNYAGTFRAPPDREAGHETLMGAMTVDPVDGRVNSILVNISPRVRIREADEAGPKGELLATAWARQTTGLRGLTDVARNFSVSSASYTLSTIRLGAYQGPASDWRARQLWLGLPDRIIGLLSTVPAREGARAYEVATVFRFISGGSAGAARAKRLRETAPNQHRYGELDVWVHEHTFAESVPLILDYRRSEFPAAELSYRRVAPVAGDGAAVWPASTEQSLVVEVGPNTLARPPATVLRLPIAPLLGLDVSVGGKRYRLCFNPTSEPKPVPPPADWPAGVATSLRVFGPGDADAPRTVERPRALVLAPGQQAAWVASPDPVDHLPGWPSFERMVAERRGE